MNFKRSDRVKELLRQEISLLVQQINDPKLGFVTITDLDISDDLNDAKIFYSVYGNDEEKENSAKVLKHAIPRMRRFLGKKLESLYRIPSFKFIFDDTPDRAQRITDILNQISEEKHETAIDSPPQESDKHLPKKNKKQKLKE